MARKPREVPNCRTCGICCISERDNDIWAEVTMADCERLGEVWCKKHILGFHPMELLCKALDGARVSSLGGIMTKWRKMLAGPFKGVQVCACSALQGSIMHKVSCSVYEKRPAVCRNALQPGEKQCLEIRRMFREAAKRV